MEGDRYQLLDGVNSVQVGSIHVGPDGYVAANEHEAYLLDQSEHLVCKPAGGSKETRAQLNERAAAAGVDSPEKLKNAQAVSDAIAALEVAV